MAVDDRGAGRVRRRGDRADDLEVVERLARVDDVAVDDRGRDLDVDAVAVERARNVVGGPLTDLGDLASDRLGVVRREMGATEPSASSTFEGAAWPLTRAWSAAMMLSVVASTSAARPSLLGTTAILPLWKANVALVGGDVRLSGEIDYELADRVALDNDLPVSAARSFLEICPAAKLVRRNLGRRSAAATVTPLPTTRSYVSAAA